MIFTLLRCWLALEIACFIFFKLFIIRFIQHRDPQKIPPYPTQQLDAPRHHFMLRILHRFAHIHSHLPEAAVTLKIKQFLSAWFFNVSFSSILKGNVQEFLAWAMYSKNPDELFRQELAEIGQFLSYVDKKHGITFKPGYDESVKCARLSCEPVDPLYRPLALYVKGFVFFALTHVILRFVCGFTRVRARNGVAFWVRRPASTSTLTESPPSPPAPVLFFHGIAPGGFFAYLPFLNLLLSGRGGLLFENNSVASVLSLTPNTEAEVLEAVEAAMDEFFPPKEKFVVAGHSVGSCCVTWVHRALPNRIETILLLDPVSLFLSNATVCTNFLHKERLGTVMENVIWFFASTELGTLTYLRRHFFWYRNEMWLEDVGDDIEVVVFLAAKDEIIHARDVREGIAKCGRKVKVIYCDNLSHAQLLVEPKRWAEVQESLDWKKGN